MQIAIIALIVLINAIQIRALNVTFNQLTSASAFGSRTYSNAAFLTTSALTLNVTHYPINSFIIVAQVTVPSTSTAVFISSNAINWQLATDLNVTLVNSSVPSLTDPSVCQDSATGDLFVLGGTGDVANVSYVSINQGMSWSAVHNNGSVNWSNRTLATCAVTSSKQVNKQVIAIAGSSSSLFGDVNAFNESSISQGTIDWHLLNARAFPPREGHTTLVMHNQGDQCDDVVYVIGGASLGSTWLNDVWISQYGGASWLSVTQAAAFSPRRLHAAAVASNGVLALSGGETSSHDLLNDLWLSFNGGYDWLLVTSSAGFAARSGHSMLFDEQSVLYVMGGSASADVWMLSKDKLDVTTLNATYLALTGHAFNATCASLSTFPCNDQCTKPAGDREFLILIACAAGGCGLILIVLILVGLHSRRERVDPEAQFVSDYGSLVDEDDGRLLGDNRM